MTDTEDWNPLVPKAQRLSSPNFNSRKPADKKPTHIIIHITGTNDFNSVKKTFTAPNSVSPHYLIHRDGSKYQFVPDHKRAYHAGIDSNTRSLYNKQGKEWQKYLKYFSWYKYYPGNSVYLDGDLNPVRNETEAVFVKQPDNLAWNHFDYFNARWNVSSPLNFTSDADPNNYSIGIETLGVGSPKQDPEVYTNEMYVSLRELVKYLCDKYGIPNDKEHVIGHEDVNPVGRFGWDPGQGFNWDRIHD